MYEDDVMKELRQTREELAKQFSTVADYHKYLDSQQYKYESAGWKYADLKPVVIAETEKQ
jgi:hypothetical protein